MTTDPTQDSPSEVYEYVIECPYDGPPHVYPGDWIFGGPHKNDPRADPRWRPSTYEYFDDKLIRLHITQTPLCDDEAIDNFTIVGKYGVAYNPVHLAVMRPGGPYEMIPWKYNKANDTATLTQ